ncbi:MAG: hypothetical protein AB1758_27345 [Candidatus Eremiobacterota bacterium]
MQRFANSNLMETGYEVFRPNRGVVSAESELTALPEEEFLMAWLSEGDAQLSTRSTPVLSAPDLAQRYGYVAPMVDQSLIAWLNTA